MVYLNGAYADHSHWRRAIADLGSDYRHLTDDERARGKSKRSADYSFEGAVRDLATGTSHRSRFTSEKGRPMTIKRSPWTGMVPVDDTALAVTDTDGDGVPVIYLNGHAGVQRQWRRVLAELGTQWRHITYDMRGRGKSKRSADYSFETNIRDVDAVLAARGVARAVVVGWSYGAFVAAHWASRNPARTVGAVLVEGAQPYDWFDESMEAGMRKIWKRLWWPMQMLRPFGMAPRMTGDQLADSNIEVGKIARERDLGPVLDSITVPARYVVASGESFGSQGGHEQVRTSLPAVTARNPNIQISAKVASNHGSILRKDYRAIAEAVREVAALDHEGN